MIASWRRHRTLRKVRPVLPLPPPLMLLLLLLLVVVVIIIITLAVRFAVGRAAPERAAVRESRGRRDARRRTFSRVIIRHGGI